MQGIINELFNGMLNFSFGNVVMFLIGGILLYLAVAKDYEPMFTSSHRILSIIGQ